MSEQKKQELCKVEKDVENRNNEFRCLDGLIEYLQTRNDHQDPSPEFRKAFEEGRDRGFIRDVIVLLLPLDPDLLGDLPQNFDMKDRLSGYVLENCKLEHTNAFDYTNEKCVNNLVKVLDEKEEQFKERKKRLEKLKEEQERS